MGGNSLTNEKIILYKCPQCNRLVPPIKRPSIAGMWFLHIIYLIYYYVIKKEECVYCNHKFSKDELKTLEKEEIN